tara:strand:+ start:6514 stop:6801 length:288 start_codon:yes stop_codon:yes gene_type:complete
MLYDQKDLEIAKGLYKNHDEKCERFARSIHKLRESRKQYDDKREKSKIIFLENAPEKSLNTKNFSNICQAVTLKGKKCTFKASCGNFCKKHAPKK